jgi:hypothetical protein
MFPNPRDHLLEFRMHQRLTAAQRHGSCAELRKLIDATRQNVYRKRRGLIVVLVAVSARKIAPPDRDQVRKNGVVRRKEPLRKELELPEMAYDSPFDSHVQWIYAGR